MEIPPVVSSEEHQSWTGLHKSVFSARSESAAFSAKGLLDTSGEDRVDPEARSNLFEKNGDIPQLKKNFVCVDYSNVNLVDSVCFQEPRVVSTSLKASLRPSDQDGSQSINQTLDSNCEELKTDLKTLKPVSNGSMPTLDARSSGAAAAAAAAPHSSCRVLSPPHVVKYNQSSITFSDYTSGSDSSPLVNESSEDGESSPEGENEEQEEQEEEDDEDDDDVFPELPHNEGPDVTNTREETEKSKEPEHEEACRREEPPLVKSPWSESMSQLMRKLDQLNLDIEEALSESSSPSNTPRVTRKKQWGAGSKSTAEPNPGDWAAERAGRGECPNRDGSSAPRSSSVGTRTGSKKTIFDKMISAAGADITESQMVLSNEHNNAAIKLTLSRRGEHSVWVQFQHSSGEKAVTIFCYKGTVYIYLHW